MYINKFYSGRINTQQWFIGVLLFIILGIIIYLLILPIVGSVETTSVIMSFLWGFGLLSLHIRRLHDVGKSGIVVIIALIPFIGPLIVLFFLLQKGDIGTNKWGQPPSKEIIKTIFNLE